MKFAPPRAGTFYTEHKLYIFALDQKLASARKQNFRLFNCECSKHSLLNSFEKLKL